jgi:tRNA threonylcarbamoyladenosine biosynthesis protein TsaE
VTAPSWSWVVGDLAELRAVLADPEDALDVRLPGELDDALTGLGAAQVVPGQLTVPVQQRLADLAATRELGARLAAELQAGDLVLLSGPLGAGKTSLTQGIGAALGVRGAVTSPTFVLARTHRGPLPLVHVDAYRLREAGARLELDDLDLDAALEDAVTVVEWGEGLAERLTDSWLHVLLERPAGEPAGGAPESLPAGRSARVVAHGPRWAAGRQPAEVTI